jgi:hypothetical protein
LPQRSFEREVRMPEISRISVEEARPEVALADADPLGASIGVRPLIRKPSPHARPARLSVLPRL